MNYRHRIGITGVLAAVYALPGAAADPPTQTQSPATQTQSYEQAGPSRRLSLTEAIHDALATNVNTLLARARKAEASGQRVTARSTFLPHISGNVSETRRQTNLAAQGFDFGSDISSSAGGGGASAAGLGLNFPTTVTYNNFDARAQLRQTLFDYSAWQNYQSAKLGEQAANNRLAVARQQVASQAELDYVAALSARRAVEAARTNLNQAKSLLALARNQQNVGTASAVDVTRARARVARDGADLAQRQTDRIRTAIQLARTVGLPLNSRLELSDKLVFRPLPLGSAQSALLTAMADRPEIALARTRIARGERDLAGARGQRLPTLSIEADYGASGNTPYDNDESTYAVGASLNLPIFSGGAIAGNIDSAASRLNQQQIQYRDTRDQVEQDVRTSRWALKTLAQRVRAARSNLTLAKEELLRSKDRFANGLGDNIEVVNAQSNLADARDSQINALAEYTRARINRAAALGRAPQFRLRHPITP